MEEEARTGTDLHALMMHAYVQLPPSVLARVSIVGQHVVLGGVLASAAQEFGAGVEVVKSLPAGHGRDCIHGLVLGEGWVGHSSRAKRLNRRTVRAGRNLSMDGYIAFTAETHTRKVDRVNGDVRILQH